MISSILKFLMGKWGGYAIVGTMGIVLALSTFGGVQTWRLDNVQDKLELTEKNVTLLTQRVQDDANKIFQRDELIKKQNLAVLSMASQAEAEKVEYQKRLEAARQRNRSLEKQIVKVREFQATNPDDIVQTEEEALKLIRETIRTYQESRNASGN